MKQCLLKEITYKTSRASGPGGQHVNKTESRVELYWSLEQSLCLKDEEKSRIRERLKTRFTDQGVLILASERSRSQLKNKEDVTIRFMELIGRSLIPPKKRKPTKPTKASKEKRLAQKKQRGEIKSRRKSPEL